MIILVMIIDIVDDYDNDGGGVFIVSSSL